MRRATFADAAAGEGAAALNRVFQRYLIPMSFSSEQLHLHMAYNDVDPSASPIWYDDDGEVVAAALLGVRGKRGWIGGFGVAPPSRGRGIARQLAAHMIDTARARRLESLALEVLVENEPAIRVYEAAGFRRVRRLLSLQAPSPSAPPPGFTLVLPAELIDEPDPIRQCWQRERATLRNGAVSSGVTDGRNFALFRYNAAVAQILKIHTDDASSLGDLAAALSSSAGVERLFVLNEPEESALPGYARSLGWTLPFEQHEMQLLL